MVHHTDANCKIGSVMEFTQVCYKATFNHNHAFVSSVAVLNAAPPGGEACPDHCRRCHWCTLYNKFCLAPRRYRAFHSPWYQLGGSCGRRRVVFSSLTGTGDFFKIAEQIPKMLAWGSAPIFTMVSKKPLVRVKKEVSAVTLEESTWRK
jgi:hypothetical protein